MGDNTDDHVGALREAVKDPNEYFSHAKTGVKSGVLRGVAGVKNGVQNGVRGVKKQIPKKPREKHLAHTTNKNFYIIIGVLIILYLFIAVGYLANIKHLREELREAKTGLAVVAAERDKYQQAYNIVLEDVKAFDKITGVGYDKTDAAQIDEDQSELPRSTGSAPVSPVDPEGVKHLQDLDVWGYYNNEGVISDACIETTKIVQTPEDIVEIVLIAQGKAGDEDPLVRLFIDAQEMDSYVITSTTDEIYKTLVELPKGTHYLDIIYANPAASDEVTISLVRIGDRTLENDLSVLDYGELLSLFDCEDTGTGKTLTKSGAMRFRIEKV